ncbi:MAG: hypothetical protein ACO35E_04580 [Ilumatobacteraceae bacterium]
MDPMAGASPDECPVCGTAPPPARARFCNRCGAAMPGATEMLPVITGTDEPTGEIPSQDPDRVTEEIGLGLHLEEVAAERRRETVETQQFERTIGIPTDEMQLIIRPVEWADDTDDARHGTGSLDDATPRATPDPTAATTVVPIAASRDDTPVSGIAVDPDQRAVAEPAGPAEAMTAPAPVPVSAPAGIEFTAISLIALVQIVVLLVAMTVDVMSISTTAGPDLTPIATSLGMRVGVWHVEHLASNLAIAGLISAIGLAVGAVASVRRLMWGPGLIGGSAVASTGVAALAVGLAESPIEAARAFAGTATSESFTVTITRDLGYWALLAAAGIGIIAFFGAMNEASRDRDRDLNPWVAALGALAVVLAVVAPLVPTGDAAWSTNWVISSDPGAWPTAMVIARLVQSGAVAVGGVIGFLIVRRFGLGMIAGVLAPGIWLALSAWIGLGASPIGPALTNPGAGGSEVGTLTVAGYLTAAAVAAVAGAIAWDRDQHRT